MTGREIECAKCGRPAEPGWDGLCYNCWNRWLRFLRSWRGTVWFWGLRWSARFLERVRTGLMWLGDRVSLWRMR